MAVGCLNFPVQGQDECFSLSVFEVQDASIKFVDLLHAVKPEPDKEMSQAQSAHDNFWDFTGVENVGFPIPIRRGASH